MSFKIGAFKNFAVLRGKRLCWSTSLIKSLYEKQTPTKMFSSEYCEIFKNNLFNGTSPVAGSEPCYKEPHSHSNIHFSRELFSLISLLFCFFYRLMIES